MNFSKRQIEILENAIELIGEGGIQNLTTKSLATKMGFSEPALYRHFNDKTEILKSVLIHYQTFLREGIEQVFDRKKTGLEQIIDLIAFQYKKFEENPAVIMVIFSEASFQYNSTLFETVANSIQKKEEQIQKIIIKGQSDESIRKKLDPLVTANIIMGSMRFTALKWMLSGFEFDLKNAAKDLQKDITLMIQSSKNKKEHK